MMDNLCNSTIFCKAAVNHEKKVLCHGVARKGMQGIPPNVQQEEVKLCKGQLVAREKTKAAVLQEGDPNCVNLMASSIYDTNPVHYLNIIAEDIKWVEVEKPVYNVDSGRLELLKFLCMVFINTYNKNMGDVDLADQLYGTYRLDIGVRNHKWWWSLMFSDFGVMLVNCYVLYCSVQLAKGTAKNI